MAPSIMYMKRSDRLWNKFLTDLRMDQHTAEDSFSDGQGGRFYPGDGLMPSQSPCYIPNVLPVPGMGSFYDIIPWGSTSILGTYWHYMFYGDEQIIRDNYEAGKKYLGHEAALRDEEGFIHHGLGDWGNPEHALLRENVETAFLYADSKTMAYFAGILGKTEEQAEFTELAEEIKANYNEKLLVQHPQDGYWYYQAWDHKDEICMTQAAEALPLYWGMVPEDKVEDVVRTFRQTLEEKGVDAVSLNGGYIAWLIDTMKQKEAEDAKEEVNFAKEVEQSLRKKFRKNIWCKFTKAINEYELVKPGDRIAVCISGGKDSMLMAKLFQELKRHNKFDFEVKFLVMDPGYSPANRQVIEENARRLEIPIEIFESDIFESVYNIEKSPCYLCARMRRGYLYSHAQKMGCNKIALGHHYDDVIETILMGMLYSAQVQTMMPKLHSTNFEGMELIRPLYMVREDDIKAWRDYNDLHFIQCACKFTDTCTTCNNEENRSKRMEIKELIATLKKVNPYVEGNIFKSVENVNLDTVVAYKSKGEKHHFLDTYDEKLEGQGE